MKRFFGKLLENKVKNSLDNSDSSLSPLFKYILFGSTGFSFFIIIVVVIATFIPVLIARQYINEYRSGAGKFFEKVGNLLTHRGWCSDSDGSCQDSAEQDFYDELNDVSSKYEKKGVTLDIELITGTIFYGYNIEGFLFDVDENGVNQSFVNDFCNANAAGWIGEFTCEKYVTSNYDKIYNKYKDKYFKIASNYEKLKKSNCDGNHTYFDSLSLHTDLPITFHIPTTVEEACQFFLWNFADLSQEVFDDNSLEILYRTGKNDLSYLASKMVSGNSLDYAKYREYLVDIYIPKRFSNLYLNYNLDVSYNRVEQIADEIMSFASYSDGDLANCNVINASCSGITIDSGQYAGTYTLEEYVAGVVSHEVGEGWPDEALKAQAIAARTFALNYTNNCTKSIGNSTNVQTFSPTTNERLINAANETAGMVLTYDNKVFSTEYASWWGNNSGSSCGGYNSCSNGQCSIDLVKLPNKEKWSFTMPQNYFAWGAVNDTIQMNDSTIHSLGGHCRGMSQFGAKYLALGENYSYDKILNTFYSPGVELSTFGNNVNSCSSGSSSTGLIASNYKGFLQRVAGPTASDYYYSQEYFYSGNVGQCVWYVQRRALEIINTVEIDEDVRQKAIKALMNTGGNGRDWWNNPSLTMFGSSTDYSKPKVGSIIVWRYTPSRIASMGADYGHVGIVEAVDYENGTMTVSDGWKPNWGNPNTLSSAAFGFRTVPFEWALNYGNPNGYIFMGYVYLLD